MQSSLILAENMRPTREPGKEKQLIYSSIPFYRLVKPRDYAMPSWCWLEWVWIQHNIYTVTEIDGENLLVGSKICWNISKYPSGVAYLNHSQSVVRNWQTNMNKASTLRKICGIVSQLLSSLWLLTLRDFFLFIKKGAKNQKPSREKKMFQTCFQSSTLHKI